MNVSLNSASNTPVEHIFFPIIVPGSYKIYVHYYSNHKGIKKETPYYLNIMIKGEIVYEWYGELVNVNQNELIVEFKFDDDDNFILIDNFND
jgi:hypothetical protein